MPSLLVVIGAGPGIGATTATLFASKEFQHVALVARDTERLQTHVDAIQKAGSKTTVKSYKCDAGDQKALQNTLEQIKAELGAPEVVLFNAARIAPTPLGEYPADSVLEEFKVMNIGLYVAATWAMPYFEAAAKEGKGNPCFFLSGSGIGDQPLPPLFSLSMQKAAQQNLMRSLTATYEPRGVHVAYLSIDGQVQDSDPELNAKNISEIYWTLYQEKKGQWRSRVVIGDLQKLFQGQ